LTTVGCFSFTPAPPYDPGVVARVGVGAPAGQVRTVLGKPTTAMPATPLPPEALAAAYPGCNSVAEEWEYAYAGCDLKMIFDDEGKLCLAKPVGPCGARRAP